MGESVLACIKGKLFRIAEVNGIPVAQLTTADLVRLTRLSGDVFTARLVAYGQFHKRFSVLFLPLSLSRSVSSNVPPPNTHTLLIFPFRVLDIQLLQWGFARPHFV